MLFSTKKLGSLHVKLTCNTLFAVLYPQSTYASIYASERSTRLPFSPQRLLEHLATVFWSPVDFISHVYWNIHCFNVWDSSVNKTKSLLLIQGETDINNLERYILLMYVFIFTFRLPPHTAYRILVSQPGLEPMASAVEQWNFNHWTTREVPVF